MCFSLELGTSITSDGQSLSLPSSRGLLPKKALAVPWGWVSASCFWCEDARDPGFFLLSLCFSLWLPALGFTCYCLLCNEASRWFETLYSFFFLIYEVLKYFSLPHHLACTVELRNAQRFFRFFSDFLKKLLKYSWFTVFQVYSKVIVIHIYIYIYSFLTFSFIIGFYMTLSVVPCAIQ